MRAIQRLLREKADRLVSLQRQIKTPDKRWDGYERFRAILGPEQLAVVDDDHALIAVCKGRRAGGTTAFLGKLLKIFSKWSYGRSLYFAPTGEQGVDILWEDLRAYNRDYDLGLEERWTEKAWTLGQRRLDLFGFNDRDDVDRARGLKSRLVWIDEAQLAPDWFSRKASEAILPTTLDYLGQVGASGTPTRVADGFFFEAYHDTTGTWSNRHHWTAAQNPFFLRQGRDPLKEARERYHLTEDSVAYRLEWLAQWVIDPEALVYVIPEAAIVATPDNTAWYGNVIGLDLGWKDHDAIGVVGVDPLRQTSRLRHMETKGQQTNHELFRRILELAPQFPGPAGDNGTPRPIVVYDPAGHATRKTIETFRSDAPQIIWVEADKKEKLQTIEWLNNDLREGSHTVEAGCSMIRESKRLQWKRPGKLAEDAEHSDQGDAWLYPYKYARNLLRRLPQRAPVRKPADPFEEHMQRMKNREQPGNYYAEKARGVG